MSECAADSPCEAHGSETSCLSVSLKVEYVRSLEYRLNWQQHMYSRRSSRRQHSLVRRPATSSSSDEEVVSKRQRTGRRRNNAGNSPVTADDGKGRDLIQAINDAYDRSRSDDVTAEGTFKELQNGKEVSDEDCGSDYGSIVSGPSTPQKFRTLQRVCSTCLKLYQKAEKMRPPNKKKVLKYDPKSLTCDQWVLIKKWRPRRLPNTRGKLHKHVKLIKKRVEMKKGSSQSEEQEEVLSVCSRPHALLQRNLRRCTDVPVKTGRRRRKKRRTQNDSQDSRAAKLQRLDTNCDSSRSRSHHRDVSNGSVDEEEVNKHDDTNLTLKTTSYSVSLEKMPQQEAPRGHKKQPKNTEKGFRDLLAQLRGNSSIVFRETSETQF